MEDGWTNGNSKKLKPTFKSVCLSGGKVVKSNFKNGGLSVPVKLGFGAWLKAKELILKII